MNHLNIEIKARCPNPEFVREVLWQENAIFKGIDHQTDTYFNCKYGRLKLREGNIENHLIHYDREDIDGPKKSLVTLYRPEPQSNLKEILTKSMGIFVIVKKKREIYFIENVKFHIDIVENLGSFVEIEAIDSNGNFDANQLKRQCETYMELFEIKNEDLINCSYSDMLLSLTNNKS